MKMNIKNNMKKSFKLFCLLGLSLVLLSSCTEQNNTATSMEINKEQIVVENLMTRRSVRAYKEQPVPQDIMNIILECGIYAPNGMNKQPWEIRVVDNKEYIDGITELYLADMDENHPRNPKKDPNFRNMFRNAPTVVFIAMEPGLCSQVDCGLLAGNMVNAAWAYGVGSCIQMAPVQFMKTEKAKEYLDKLSFSEGYELLMAVGFGYPDEQPQAKPRIKEKIKFIN